MNKRIVLQTLFKQVIIDEDAIFFGDDTISWNDINYISYKFVPMIFKCKNYLIINTNKREYFILFDKDCQHNQAWTFLHSLVYHYADTGKIKIPDFKTLEYRFDRASKINTIAKKIAIPLVIIYFIFHSFGKCSWDGFIKYTDAMKPAEVSERDSHVICPTQGIILVHKDVNTSVLRYYCGAFNYWIPYYEELIDRKKYGI